MVGITKRGVCGAIVGLVAMLGTSCAVKRVHTQVDLPPKAEPMRGEKQVAVADFEGTRRYRQDATREVREAISAGPTQSLVPLEDGARMRAVEQKLANNETVGEVGSQTPDMLIAGSVLRPNYTKRVEESEKEKCVEENDVGECVETEVVSIYETIEECSVGVTARALDVTDRRVVFEKTVDGVDHASRTAEERIPNPIGQRICDRAFDDAVQGLIPWLTAVRQNRVLTFHNVKDSGGTDRAIKAAESGQSRRARQIFEQVVKEPNLTKRHRGWARYNLALMYFAQSRFRKCVKQVNLGLRHLPGKNKLMRLKSECSLYAD
jgi:hypothetical protein